MTISAKIILDSVANYGNRHEPVRLTTMQLRYPKFIHGEFMTHRVFSRNASSSRAIPVSRMIEDVIRDTAGPVHWGLNQKGMQADQENDALLYLSAGHPDPDFRNEPTSKQMAWTIARDNAIKMAEAFDRAGYHKQIVNRLIEPFVHINVLVTATEWSNFYELRRHKDAQPEIHELADRMWEAQRDSVPQRLEQGQWHCPYVSYDDFFRTKHDKPGNEDIALKISAARCARVSYLTQEGKVPTIEEDLDLFDRLMGAVPFHASPTEHQATPDNWLSNSNFGEGAWLDPEQHGNFNGWRQFRHVLGS